MQFRTLAGVRAGWQLVVEKLKARARERLVCRECGRQVKLLAEICDYCGAGSPVKINVQPGVLIAAAAALALVVTVFLW